MGHQVLLAGCFTLVGSSPESRSLRLGGRRSATGHFRTHAAQHHSMTSSARTSIEGGTVRPSALAIFTLITNSNFVGCSTGRSDGLVPLRILSI